MPSVAAVLTEAARQLRASDSARLDAELLLAHVLGWSRSRLLAYPEAEMPDSAADLYRRLVADRACGSPVAYLTGRRDFWSLELSVGPAVLVPRPETELLVELALRHLAGRPSPAVADLGTGSGAIGLAIATERPDARVVLVDRSAAAAGVASDNARRLGLGGVDVRTGDWFAPLDPSSRFDVVVSNPPYLAEHDPHLGSPELRHEPRGALVSGPTGLEALTHLAGAAGAYLVAGGLLLLEHGSTQGSAVRELLAARGFTAVGTARDLAGHERATSGRSAS